MRWFPVQYGALYTAETPEQARNTILRSRIKLISCIYQAQQTVSGSICMTPKADQVLFHDSFVPIVTAEINEKRDGSEIRLRGELPRSLKIFWLLFRAVLTIFTVAVIMLAENGTVRISMLGLMLLLILWNEGMPRLLSRLRFRSFLREFQSECIK